MNMPFQLAKLADLLTRSDETIDLQPDAKYRQITVKLWGKGVVLRGIISGAEIAASKQNIARQGQFILSRIDARNGALGIVPPELDEAVVTNDFPTFNVRSERLLPEYLGWLCRTASFVEECKRASEGTTNRVRLQENKFLAREIHLPEITEQRKILERINDLAKRVDAAKTLRQQAIEDCDALLIAMAHRADLTPSQKTSLRWRHKSVSDMVQLVDNSHKVEPGRSYPNLGIYSFARGLFHKAPIDGLATSATALRQVQRGQFIYSRLFAFEGAYGWVSSDFDGAFVSQEYPTFDCDPNQVRAEFLAAHFKARNVWASVAEGSKGLGDRRQRVQPEHVLNYKLWVPPLPEQDRLAEVWKKIAILNAEQEVTGRWLDALVPSVLDRAFNGLL